MELSVDDLFNNGRTCYNFKQEKLPDGLLKEIYDLMKFGPTSANSCPLRIMFIESKSEKEKLLNCVMAGNMEAVQNAPVTALFAYDARFYEKMPELFPHNAGMQNFFSSDPSITFDTAFRNSTLQAAYFIIAARSKGLAAGPMSGFDKDKLEKTFFADSNLKINFICNLGYPEGNPRFERLPRLDFDEVCKII